MVVPCRDSNSFRLLISWLLSLAGVFLVSSVHLIVHGSTFRALTCTLRHWTIPRAVLLSVCPVGGSRKGTLSFGYVLCFARQVGRTSSTQFPSALLVHPRELVFLTESLLWSCSGQASENQCLGIGFAPPAVFRLWPILFQVSACRLFVHGSFGSLYGFGLGRTRHGRPLP